MLKTMKKAKGKKKLRSDPGESVQTAPSEEGESTSVIDDRAPDGTDQTIESQEVGSGDDAAPSAEEVAAPESLEELLAKVGKLQDNLLRAKADFQNLLRRSTIERADAVRYANADFMKSMLGVLDDFERSLAAAEGSDKLDAVTHGVRLVYDNLTKAMRNHGLETIDALNEPFDPSVHEAMLQQPSDDHPPGTVIEQVARGYRLYGRVLRPAKVIVSKEAESDSADRLDTEASVQSEGESKDD